MTIQDLGSLGELVAAIATIATLAYLALQIRQNTSAIKSTAHQAVTDSFNNVNMALGKDPALARIVRIGSFRTAELTEDERTQYFYVLLSFFRVFETHFYQSRMGAAEVGLFGSEIDWMLGVPGVREWWEATPFLLSPGFRGFIDDRISEIPRRRTAGGDTASSAA